jgi:hypothetical protein
MTDVDPNAWIAAAKRYKTLRRRCWRTYFTSIIALALVFVPSVSLQGRLSQGTRSAAFAACGVVMVAVAFANFRAWLALVRFPCPRCGQRFGTACWRWRCPRCELQLAAAAKSL